MTTTIRETTAPQSPVVEPLTDVERRARVLEAAALEIEVRGWTQGSGGMFSAPGHEKVCLLGGIGCALGGPRTYQACGVVFGKFAAEEIYSWNDWPDRTADEVTFLLRWRAAELRDGWDAA